MEKERTAQALLSSVAEAKSQIARLSRRLQFLQVRCQSLTAAYGPKSGSGNGNGGQEEIWCQLAEEKERLTEQLRLVLTLERRVEALIDRLPKDRWRMVLRYRYLDALPFAEVAEQLSQDLGRACSELQVYRIHRQALEAAETLWRIETDEP